LDGPFKRPGSLKRRAHRELQVAYSKKRKVVAERPGLVPEEVVESREEKIERGTRSR